jgi:hypothetical protein
MRLSVLTLPQKDNLDNGNPEQNQVGRPSLQPQVEDHRLAMNADRETAIHQLALLLLIRPVTLCDHIEVDAATV